MKIENVHPSKVKRYPGNPRRNSQAVPAVRKSLESFGWRQPIVVDKSYVIIAGDTRYCAALEMGATSIPVHVAKDLTEAQVIAYRLADNRVGSIAEDDEERVLTELALLLGKEGGDGFDMSVMGFTDAELAGFTGEIAPEKDIRYLQDFEVMPQAKPKWILISAPEDQCAVLMNALKKLKTSGTKIEYSGDNSPPKFTKG